MFIFSKFKGGRGHKRLVLPTWKAWFSLFFLVTCQLAIGGHLPNHLFRCQPTSEHVAPLATDKNIYIENQNYRLIIELI